MSTVKVFDMSAQEPYENRYALVPAWVSSVELTWADSSEVYQASHKGKCPCKKAPQVRVCVTATRDKNEATLEVA